MTQNNINNVNIRSISRSDLRASMRGPRLEIHGKVMDIVGNVVHAVIKGVSLGSVVTIEPADKGKAILAEVVGFRDEKALLIPFSSLTGVSPGCVVASQGMWDLIPVGDHLLGRVVDPFMQSLNEVFDSVPAHPEKLRIENVAPNPMLRTTIENPFSLGVRAIDGLLTFGEGQRIGVFAGSGVGKSVLMGMIAQGSDADVNVIGLIGERGREVKEFLEKDLGAEGLKKSVVVVVTSDQSPSMRVRAALVTTTIAEYFSSRGKKVLLMMDSLTRVAMAQREIGLAIGEPPTTKGYTPSVFSLLPRLLERCGPQEKSRGSISGLFTVLVDGDDFDDPIADSARAILDGHIVLSRAIAARGHYPAIDIGMSVSRVMNKVVSPQ
ncbi:MAG: FliI/YscN family ATPase, partial [Oligoflexales bacterium]|nr:FliI/YscN family ATPase [Oligoflexales bacterium]